MFKAEVDLYRPRSVILVCALLAAGLHGTSMAQNTVPADSLRHYDLNEIVVSDGTEEAAEILTIQRIRLAEIARVDAGTVENVTRLIPAAHLQTNSRGESLVYIRNAGERQVAIFLDGALLNVPWDNRVDLSLVPASMIGSITVAKGASSVLYGTNVLGGAVNLVSRQVDVPVTELTASYSDPTSIRLAANRLGHIGRVNYALSAGYVNSDGIALPDGANLPFSQAGDAIRTNTDRRLFNVFGRAAFPVGSRSDASITLSHYSGEKGVAAEGHLDPSQSSVRYWRIPLLSNTSLIGNYASTRGALTWRATGWVTSFGQAIDQFESIEMVNVSETQDDVDVTAGIRLVATKEVGPGVGRVSINGFTSRHSQTDAEVDSLGETDSIILDYRQHVYSIGAEYRWSPSDSTSLTFGGSLDGIATPKTGDKPSRSPDQSFSVLAGASHILDDNLTIRLSTGRKVRFPTPRELFGEALGRFLVNPDLKPESSYLAEVGIAFSGTGVSGEVVPFFNRTFDTIDRMNVDVDGQRLRQRVNLDGSRIYGIEVNAAAAPGRHVEVGGNATWSRARALTASGIDKMAEKPEWIINGSVEVKTSRRVRLLTQFVYTGRAYGLAENNDLVSLPTSLVVSGRLSWLVSAADLQAGAELFARVDNIFDDVVLPQLGLPGPGRSLAAGISLSF